MVVVDQDGVNERCHILHVLHMIHHINVLPTLPLLLGVGVGGGGVEIEGCGEEATVVGV